MVLHLYNICLKISTESEIIVSLFLKDGHLLTGLSKAWLGRFGEIGHPYSHPSSKQCDAAAGNHAHDDLYYREYEVNNLLNGKANSIHNHSVSDITSGVLPVTQGGTGVTSMDGLKTALGIGGSTQGMSYYLKSLTVGKVVWFNYDHWRVVHIANGLYYLIIDEITQTTQFGNNTAYKGSTIATKCATYQNDMADDSLALCQNVTVNGVTAKVFIPSYEQMNGGFSYFNNASNRVAFMGDNITWYWTSSPHDGSYVWYVNTGGGLHGNRDPSSAGGFRPCVAVRV